LSSIIFSLDKISMLAYNRPTNKGATMSFHLTESKDGKYRAGDVVRTAPEDEAFSDAVILGFDTEDIVKLARPYAYVSCVGTLGIKYKGMTALGPHALMGVENYSVTLKTLSLYKIVGKKRTVT
jgi:hypothetical protein